MKTLRNTFIIALVAACLTSVSAFGHKGTKVVRDSEIRNRVANLLQNSDIRETGLVDILFRIENDRIKVISIKGDNLQLNEQIKSWLEINKIYLKGQVGSYEVKINMNRANSIREHSNSEQVLRTRIAGVLANATIYKTGKATILFEVTNDKKVEILRVTSQDNTLAVSVKDAINMAGLIAPEGLSGKYEVDVKF
jgi:hypothetical protein